MPNSLLLVAATMSMALLVVSLALAREVRWRRALQTLVSRLLEQLRRMRNQRLCWILWAGLLILICGCNEDERLVKLSEQAATRQAEHNQHIARQSREVTSTVHDLVAADAKARDQLLTTQKSLEQSVQAERARLDARRLELDREAAELAAARERDSLLAAAIPVVGVVLACLLPLMLCIYQLRALAKDSGQNELASLLTYELIEAEPLQLGQEPTTARLQSSIPADDSGESA